MRPTSLAFHLSALLVVGYLLAAGGTASSWSDGNAGATGAIPEHLKKCSPGLNSHTVSNLQPNQKYKVQAIGQFGSGDPKEDLGQILEFSTPATASATQARDDQIMSLLAAHVAEKSMTLYGGYSTGTENGDELEKFVFVYVIGDQRNVADLRRLGGSSTTVPAGPLSTILSTTIGGLQPGETYTFQTIGQRVSKGAWERVGKPTLFKMEVSTEERIETVPPTPGDTPTQEWTLQMMSSSPQLGGRTFSKYFFVYNLASRVPDGTTDLRDTPSHTSVDKGKPHSGFKYCKVRVSGCGGCHGDFEAMQHQRASEAPVIDRISGELRINGRAETWEYEPGKSYVLDIYIEVDYERWGREPGFYNKASLSLNTSAGKFQLHQDDAANLRITGGNFSHAGSKNKDAYVCLDPPACSQKRPYGQTVDDEGRWAGELTNTALGGNKSMEDGAYHWRAVWIAPAKQEPHGSAFNMAIMIPNGDGVDSCTYDQCNISRGYNDQLNWDWWSYLIPRKIMCEKGVNRQVCEAKVYASILPPSPPLDTNGPGDDGGNGDDGGLTPTLPGEAIVSLAIVAWLAAIGRRKR